MVGLGKAEHDRMETAGDIGNNSFTREGERSTGDVVSDRNTVREELLRLRVDDAVGNVWPVLGFSRGVGVRRVGFLWGTSMFGQDIIPTRSHLLLSIISLPAYSYIFLREYYL
ncbi:hypothetical protein K435DRAFT_793007 [Dendrothele bispora CBS 962.96]|uniref:Uncharacterized protein n=1 Tax=Dendrothele bispora (strain CBS 962.96) TaxID=1314807 RepID=A0A4S8MHE9_DENBC|nr:hypothetical protein K435DRAFT_793007 [Dendrothele bispora CBS 962.96]